MYVCMYIVRLYAYKNIVPSRNGTGKFQCKESSVLAEVARSAASLSQKLSLCTKLQVLVVLVIISFVIAFIVFNVVPRNRSPHTYRSISLVSTHISPPLRLDITLWTTQYPSVHILLSQWNTRSMSVNKRKDTTITKCIYLEIQVDFIVKNKSTTYSNNISEHTCDNLSDILFT